MTEDRSPITVPRDSLACARASRAHHSIITHAPGAKTKSSSQRNRRGRGGLARRRRFGSACARRVARAPDHRSSIDRNRRSRRSPASPARARARHMRVTRATIARPDSSSQRNRRGRGGLARRRRAARLARVRPTTVRRSIVTAALVARPRHPRARARVTCASRARQSRVPTHRHNVTVAAAVVSHAAGARLGLRGSACARAPDHRSSIDRNRLGRQLRRRAAHRLLLLLDHLLLLRHRGRRVERRYAHAQHVARPRVVRHVEPDAPAVQDPRLRPPEQACRCAVGGGRQRRLVQPRASVFRGSQRTTRRASRPRACRARRR